jgi:hypothetical protein
MVSNITLFHILLVDWAPLLRWPKSGPGGDVVHVLYNVTGKMIDFRRDVLVAVFVFPHVEFGNQQVFGLFSRGIKLNPLEGDQRDTVSGLLQYGEIFEIPC